MRREVSAVFLAVLLAGCGSGQPSPSATPVITAAPTPTLAPTPTPVPTPTPEPTVDPLRLLIWQAARDTIEKDTVSLDMDLIFNGSVSIADGTTIAGTGHAAFSRPMRVALTADYGGLGLGKLKLIVNGDLLYLKGDVLANLKVASGKWLLVDLSSSDPRAVPFLGITRGQNDVSVPIYYLFGAQSPVRTLDDELLGGSLSKHYAMSIDVEAATTVAPEASRANLLDSLAALRTAGVDKTIKADVWIDAGGLVRRVLYVYTVDRIAGGGTMTITYTFDDFGEPLDLGIPADKDIVDLEDV